MELEQLLEKEREFRKLIRTSQLTVRPLHADFEYALSQWRVNRRSQFWARTAIRCMCAAIEATLFTFRSMAVVLAEINKFKFSQKEIEILTEKRTVIENGVEKTRSKFLPMRESVVESFELFAKALGANIAIDHGDGYTAVCATFEVRNRLMHPKSTFALEVRESDLRTADRAIYWFNTTQLAIVEQCKAQVSTQVDELKRRARAGGRSRQLNLPSDQSLC